MFVTQVNTHIVFKYVNPAKIPAGRDVIWLKERSLQRAFVSRSNEEQKGESLQTAPYMVLRAMQP